VTLFCLSNNSDVEVIGSLLLAHCVLLPRAVCLFFSLCIFCFSLQMRYVRSIDSLSCADSEGHRSKLIGVPIRSSCVFFLPGTVIDLGLNIASYTNRPEFNFDFSVETVGVSLKKFRAIWWQ
jgi:hypothetical protein